MDDRRLVEQTFPVKEISEESAREKSIRHGHISTLHIWWARRPLASSRAINYASLIKAAHDPKSTKRIREFIVRLSEWTNSLDRSIIAQARIDILNANGGSAPKVLDPFAGGGAIPLEALRLGCETYVNDYNPVAVLILKCTLEYPQKFGSQTVEVETVLKSDRVQTRLLSDVKKWGGIILREISKELGKYYPSDMSGSTPVGYIWSKTIPCQNPSCGAEIPLVRQYWLAVSHNKRIALRPFVSGKEVRFKIVGTGYEVMPKDFDPSKGTVRGAVATCLVCGSVTDDGTVRRLFREKRSGQRMIAVINDTDAGRNYRIANEDDISTFKQAEGHFKLKRISLLHKWGIDPVPDEAIQTPDGKEYQPGNLLYHFASIVLYGLTRWGDLFNSRQKLTPITLVERVRNAHQRMIIEGLDPEYARAVVSYLALAVDRLADYSTTLCVLNPTGGRGVKNTFSRQALQMVWDYTESNPFNPAGAGWPTACEKNEKWITHASSIIDEPREITQSSATSIPYPNDFFDAVFTDPPYYDNVPYSVLSDFFYVWLKRSIGDLYPDLFSTPLTPKSQEAIADLPLLRGMGKEKALKIVKGIKSGEIYEQMLKESFREFYRVLKVDGISVIVYAHKSTAGWEKLINSLLDSGLLITAAWPIHTEKKGRLNSQETASLASSIYMVARKTPRKEVGFYKEIKEDLQKHVSRKLDALWNEGISGPDFFIAGIGSAIEVFGKYEKVIDDEGLPIRGDRLLEDVRRIVTDYAVKQVLHNGFAGEIKPMTRFYVLWRWAYGNAIVDYDEARKLGSSVGIDITQEWNKSFIRKEKEFVEVLGPEERNISSLDDSVELIDVLHRVLLLWKIGNAEELTKVLSETGYGKSDVFYRVAQATSESLPSQSGEKRLLEGFLAGKEHVVKEVQRESGQTRLFE